MVAVRVQAKVSGVPRKPRPSVILDVEHMKAIGEAIAAPLRVNLAAGLDADGHPLAPEVGTRGDGIPGHETGALAASIRARRTKGGKLVVMPDYKRFPYGIYLAQGVDKVATLTAIIAKRMKKRRDYKTTVDRRQVKRAFMGMSEATLDEVAAENAATFKGWVENIRPATGLSEGRSALGPLPGALK